MSEVTLRSSDSDWLVETFWVGSEGGRRYLSEIILDMSCCSTLNTTKQNEVQSPQVGPVQRSSGQFDPVPVQTSFSPFHQPVLQGFSLLAETQVRDLILSNQVRASLGREHWTLIQDRRRGRTSIQLHHLLSYSAQLLLLQREDKLINESK